LPAIFRTLDKALPAYRMVYQFILFLCKLLLIAVICLTVISVVTRYAGQHISWVRNPPWSEELTLTGMAYVAVFSAALAISKKTHIRMTAFDAMLPKALLRCLDILADLAILFLAYIMIFWGWRAAIQIGASGFYTSLPNLSRFWMYLPIPLAGIAMVVFEIESLYLNIRGFFVKEEDTH